MPDILDLSELTFTAEQVRDINKLVFEDTYVNPAITDFLNILTGIESGTLVGYVGLMDDVGKTGKLGCDPTPSNRGVAASQAEWNPKTVSDRLKQCYDDIMTTAAVYSQKKGVDRADLTGTDYMDIITQRLDEAIAEMMHRIAWFSDTDAANVDDSPAGTVTAGINVNLINAIDGLWKQGFAIVAGNSARLTPIANNANSTYATQDFSDTDTTNKVATKFLRKMVKSADTRLRGKKDLIIIATRSVVDQYEEELGSYGTLESSFAILQNGMKVPKVKGVPVIAFDLWDRLIAKYFDNGTKLDKPHRAVLCSKSESLWLGLENEEAFRTFSMFYDKKDRANYIDLEFMVDAKIAQAHQVQFAY